MTALPPLASADALQERLGADVVVDDDRLAASLADASSLVRSYLGLDYVDDDDELETVPHAVETVTLSVARRDYETVRGVVSERIGSVATTYGTDRSGDMGEVLRLTDTEKAMLDRVKGTPRLWALRTTRGDNLEGGSTSYVDVVGGGDPIPWRDLQEPV